MKYCCNCSWFSPIKNQCKYNGFTVNGLGSCNNFKGKFDTNTKESK